MLIDLSLPINKKMIKKAAGKEPMVALGHLGTHFDVCDKVFSLEFTNRKGIVFNVRGSELITEADVDLDLVEKETFVGFYTGFVEDVEYGTDEYFSLHPQLSTTLINLLIDKGISMIGIDFAGLRRGEEHTPMDIHCADKGVFIIENLCNLDKVLNGKSTAFCQVMVYPINFTDMSGLPCRVVARIE
ncbi:MAG: cyclase family protein [Clostridia bacterium]|nr:cyclase family protein [Clostridia bacterium]